MNRIQFIEPDSQDNIVTVTCSKEYAIKEQKRLGSLKGYTYESDQDALDDFMIVNWAKEV